MKAVGADFLQFSRSESLTRPSSGIRRCERSATIQPDPAWRVREDSLAFLDQGRIELKLLSQRKEYRSTGRQLPVGARPVSRSILIIGVLVVAVSSPGQLAWSQSSTTIGYEVRAAFLFNFAKFIDWPSGSFANPQSPFTICVLGKDPFRNILDDELQGKTIGDRPLVVRRLNDKVEARRCQILFVSTSEQAHLAEIFASLQGANVLLIGDTLDFAAFGGTIEFTLEENHVRFTINIDAANRSGLIISSKLLALAKIVHDQPHIKGG